MVAITSGAVLDASYILTLNGFGRHTTARKRNAGKTLSQNGSAMKIIVTDIPYQMPEDVRTGSIKSIEDRLGWWTEDGDIYVWKPALTKIQILGFVVHELFEYCLVKKLGCNENNPWPHRFACIIEMVVTLGRAWPVLCWR